MRPVQAERSSCQAAFKEAAMRVLHRGGVNKRRSAGKFRSQIRRTKGANVKGPMRGGIRL